MRREIHLSIAGETWRLLVPSAWMPHVGALFLHLSIRGGASDVDPDVTITLSESPASASARASAEAMRRVEDADASFEHRRPDRILHASRMCHNEYRHAERAGEVALLEPALASTLLGTNLLLRQVAWRALERGMIPLHAAAIGGAQGFWLLPAASGSGKSVATAIALTLGLETLGDDFVVWDPSTDLIHSLYASVRLRPDGLALVRRHRPAFGWRELGHRDDGKTILQPESGGFRACGTLRGVLVPGDGEPTAARVLAAFSSSTPLLRSIGFPPATAFTSLAALARRTPAARWTSRAPLPDLETELLRLGRGAPT